MKKGIIKTVALLALAAALFEFTSCNGKKNGTSGDTVRKIIAVTGAGSRPQTFIENGVITGYETDVLKEVFSRLPQYELTIQKIDFESIFTSLDAGIYQIGYNQFEYNRTRGEKYNVSDVSGIIPRGVAIRNDFNEIKGIFDFPGHTTMAQPTNANANLFRRWNEANPDKKINLKLVDNSLLGNWANDLSDGKIDFYYHFITSLSNEITSKGVTNIKLIEIPTADKVKFTGVPDGMFFLFPKDEEKLAADYNKAFEEALADGSIHKIFVKYYDGVLTEKLDSAYIQYIKDFISEDLKK